MLIPVGVAVVPVPGMLKFQVAAPTVAIVAARLAVAKRNCQSAKLSPPIVNCFC